MELGAEVCTKNSPNNSISIRTDPVQPTFYIKFMTNSIDFL